MMVIIAQVILQEFAKDPESIGISDASHYLATTEDIFNEIEALKQNFTAFDKIIVFLEDSIEAFCIISKNSDRVPAKPQEVLKLLNLISRARFYCTELIERIKLFEKNTLIKPIKKKQENNGLKMIKITKSKNKDQAPSPKELSQDTNSAQLPHLIFKLEPEKSQKEAEKKTEFKKEDIIFQHQVY